MRRPVARQLQWLSNHPRISAGANGWRGGPVGRRCMQIQATPSTSSPTLNGTTPPGANAVGAETPDARFEVVGAPYSLLSVSLTPSQHLYTRRGTLVGLSGKADNVVSTMRVLEPFRRVILGIPFLYQRISSTSPMTAFISVRSPITSFAIVNLNGTVDWIVAQRQALLAWTGHALSISPTVNRKMSLAHWGNSYVSGRGLLALAGKGQVYSVELKSGEQFIAHPSNILGYTVNQKPPRPYRFKSSSLRLQVPSLDLGRLVPDTKFFRVMRESETWKGISLFLFTLRTWSRRTIWGDRLFLQFEGPATLLVQSRASRMSDVLTTRDVNEMADSPAGVTQEAVVLLRTGKTESDAPASTSPSSAAPGHSSPPLPSSSPQPGRISVASIRRDGKVDIQEAKDFQEFR